MPAAARRQKRAGLLTLSLMGLTPLVLLMWDPMYRDVQLFSSLAGCEQNSPLSAEQCRLLYDEALRRNTRTAPSYATFSACESDFIRVSGDCKDGQWCAADAVQNCTLDADGLARPTPAAFLASSDLVARLRDGEVADLSMIDDEELQPVFGMSEDALYGSSGSYAGGHYMSYVGRSLSLFTGQGHYLGDRSTRQLSLHRSHLQAGYAQQFQGNQLPARFQASASRGGFGATARSSMAMASG
jgi:uncharacterized protein YgiB involved in biofilm formation